MCVHLLYLQAVKTPKSSNTTDMWGTVFVLFTGFYYTVLVPILVANEKQKRKTQLHLEYNPKTMYVLREITN